MRRGVASAVAGLLVAVIILAAATAYLGFLVSQKSNASTESGATSPNVVVTHVQAANGIVGSDQTSTGAPTDSITVTGTGQVSYTPDEALVSVSVVTNAATAENATTTNAATTTKVIEALNSIGVGNSSIQTQGYSLYPNYANSYGNAPPTITSYTATNSLTVNLTASSAAQLGLKAGQVIDTSVAAGANRVSLQFTASNSFLSQLNNQALQQAVASAGNQAQAIASSLGVKITGVISAVSGGSSSYGPYYEPVPVLAATTTTIASLPTPIAPGTQTVSAAVTVVYSIS